MADTKTAEFLGTGRRKTSIARVRLSSGSGKVTVNGRAFENYFPTDSLRMVRRRPHRPGRRGAPWYFPRIAARGRCPSSFIEGGRHADSRFAYERAQKIRPAGRSQTFPIQQTLIELEFCKTRWPNGQRVFCFNHWQLNVYECSISLVPLQV